MKTGTLTEVGSKIILVLVLAGATLTMVGCSEQMQALKHNQSRIEGILQYNNQQSVKKLASLQKSQNELKKEIRENSRQISLEIASIEGNQMELQGQINDSVNQINGGIASVEENQVQMYRSFEGSTRQLSKNAGSLVSLRKQFNNVQEMVAKMNRQTEQVTAQTTGIADGQTKMHELQNGISGNIEQLIASTENVRQNLITLKKIMAQVQNSSENVNSQVAEIGKKQLTLDEEIGSNIRLVMRNIEEIERLNETVFPGEGTTKTASAKGSVKQPKEESEN